MLALIYLGMLIYDFSVVALSVYLVAERSWSAWWILGAVFIIQGSNPKNIIRVWKGEKEKSLSEEFDEMKKKDATIY